MSLNISVKLYCLELKYMMRALLAKVEMMVIMIVIWNTVLGRLAVPQLTALQPEILKHPASEPCPKSSECLSRPHAIFKVYLNFILPSTCNISQVASSHSEFLTKILYTFLIFYCAC